MADKETTRICVQIIQDHFGTIPAKVAAELLGRGRLRLAHIVRATRIKPRLVANAILILIQHNVLYHSESSEGEMFEVNWEEVLARLRFGRYIALAGQLFGDSAAEIVSLVMDHGKFRGGDILPYLVPDNDTKRTTRYASALTSLVESQYIKPTAATLQISPRDRLIRYEQEAEAKKRAEAGAKKGPLAGKEIIELKVLAQSRYEEEIAEIEASGLKRKAKESLTSRTNKRQKGNDELINEDAYFRINFAKFNVHIRNKLIETSVEQRYNESASLVMRAILLAALPREAGLSDTRSNPINIQSISMHIPQTTPLTGLAFPKSRKIDNSLYIKEYINILCAADNPTQVGRDSAFLSTSGVGGGAKKVAVEYENIGRRLRLKVFESFVRERWGDNAVRVIRILLDKGKMDEKHISKVAMMTKKDVQPLLTELSSASLISLQEVPRGADRSAMRTIYLWYIDLAKTYSVILTSLYKTLGNILVRTQHETAKVRSILDKRERSDVRGDESLLGRGERDALRDWEEKRLRLGVLERRVEECVFVLRDLAPDGYAGEHSGR